jgi:hypothetical protein
MAIGPVIAVIYIIITSQMKTLHTPSPVSTPSTTLARIHAFLAIVGVMIAIVCAFILLQDAPLPHAVETSKLSIGGFSKLTNLVQVASSWQF